MSGFGWCLKWWVMCSMRFLILFVWVMFVSIILIFGGCIFGLGLGCWWCCNIVVFVVLILLIWRNGLWVWSMVNVLWRIVWC